MSDSSKQTQHTPSIHDRNGHHDWEAFKTNITQASEASPDASVRGRGLLSRVDYRLRSLDAFLLRFVPENMHPLVQSGAIANFMFIVATITGFLLLIWYVPSVHYAYDSVVGMGERPLTAELTRSLHRYSSDAFMLFVLIHAIKMFFAGRFTGSRWVAWVTGIAGVAIVWFIGWTGYWLVWDERGALVATGTAKLMDVIPLFSEPLSASFLTNESFTSALFLVVFFLHMLVPVAFIVAIWLHVSRLNKPGFIPDRRFMTILTVSLIAVALLYPADVESRADLMTATESLAIDYFYLIPLLLTERLEGGMLWLITLGATGLLVSIPWLLTRRKTVDQPEVLEDKCNGCTQCFQDCPYNAITMVPRDPDDMNRRKSEQVAKIDPSICVSCGICVGSCDPVGIQYPNLSPWDTRRTIDRWLDKQKQLLTDHYVAFVCGNSAGDTLEIDSDTGQCRQLPGYLVFAVPCAGWVHPSMIERALKKGAGGVLVAGCKSDPDFRLGNDWLEDRIEGQRHPGFASDRFETERVCYLQLDKPETGKLLQDAQRFRNREAPGAEDRRPASRWKKAVTAALLFGLFSLLTLWPSSAGMPLPEPETTFVVAFEFAGRPTVVEERADDHLADHMQSPERERVRQRADTWVRVQSGGQTLFEETYSAGGFLSGHNGTRIIDIPIEPGEQTLTVQFGDNAGEELEWLYQDSLCVELTEGERKVLRFNEQRGFRWY